MLIAAGFSYAVVRPGLAGEEHATARASIEGWLVRVANSQNAIKGGPGACCNNHLYRRALGAALAGSLAGDGSLLDMAENVLAGALGEMRPDGSLPRETARGRLALHYQNYAVLYLVTLAEILERSGRSAYARSIDGRSLADAVRFDLLVAREPERIRSYAREPQDLTSAQGSRYWGWLEIWLRRYPDPGLERFMAGKRPVYNRSPIGAATLLFAPSPS